MPKIIKLHVFLAVWKVIMSVSVSEKFASARLFIKKSGIRHLHVKNYQNIPSSLEVIKSVSVSEKFGSVRLFIKKSGIRESH